MKLSLGSKVDEMYKEKNLRHTYATRCLSRQAKGYNSRQKFLAWGGLYILLLLLLLLCWLPLTVTGSEYGNGNGCEYIGTAAGAKYIPTQIYTGFFFFDFIYICMPT